MTAFLSFLKYALVREACRCLISDSYVISRLVNCLVLLKVLIFVSTDKQTHKQTSDGQTNHSTSCARKCARGTSLTTFLVSVLFNFRIFHLPTSSLSTSVMIVVKLNVCRIQSALYDNTSLRIYYSHVVQQYTHANSNQAYCDM